MDALGYLLILGVVVGAIVLIVYCFRQGSEQDTNVGGSYYSDPIPPIPEPVKSKDHHTIYMFERTTRVCICPRCDGENNTYRDRCGICGYALTKGGWSF